MATVFDVQFEHYLAANSLGVHETRPRLSWKFQTPLRDFRQQGYEAELSEEKLGSCQCVPETVKVTATSSTLGPWPFETFLKSRQRISVRVRLSDERGQKTPWREPAQLEIGLLSAATGVYEAGINGLRIGDYLLAPGWTAYDGRLQYQTYDVTQWLVPNHNVLGIRAAEGWFSGGIGFEGGHRNIWGDRVAVLAQLEITYRDGRVDVLPSGGSWKSSLGPIRRAEIYDGEKYDATLEVSGWSSPAGEDSRWGPVLVLPRLSDSVRLTSGYSEPVRRVQTINPLEKIQTPSGKTIFDFGQNLVGYTRLKHVSGARGHKVILLHAEVLENEELGTRPLRECDAKEEYTLMGAANGEAYEPRFTFHGFRYVQVDNWPGGQIDSSAIEVVVCRTDMKPAGSFSCSVALLDRGNFLSVPTDCPQRDERLGWTGDLAIFAPTSFLLFNCFNMLRNWLIDVQHDQAVLGGIPPMVSPNNTIVDPVWFYQETGNISILAQQYGSIITWMKTIPKNKNGGCNLWEPTIVQLGDWLDPAVPSNKPWMSPTDSKMVANMYLIQSLDPMVEISGILGKTDERAAFETEAAAARAEFQREYITPSGRLVSDTQAAYALVIYFSLLDSMRKNEFKIATGFASTPFICPALARTGHLQVAYSMLLETRTPLWLYPVTIGATTVWERWDSMLPDGSIKPGKMTSFNHYAFDAVAKFMIERIAGLRRLEPGWKRVLVAPAIGASHPPRLPRFPDLARNAAHITPHGRGNHDENSVLAIDKVSADVSHAAVVVKRLYSFAVDKDLKGMRDR
ncbi:bacterial alpha-L-rhamnosidase-domain-containing protein [Dactylonectria macrodidyma]|uniref:alpha-L-rhamnosidase n=1 Tax=Dactylonectria macrodidyma TaxID=307937 RepID=A0A9P9ENJ7_9HYPO|nr:bacterial alpha-L-rhamnosidase-domain-containing protein [Dactylonectria macrodidyma]